VCSVKGTLVDFECKVSAKRVQNECKTGVKVCEAWGGVYCEPLEVCMYMKHLQ